MITITLPSETINACLVALSKFPYSEAQPHIDLIRAATAAGTDTITPTTTEEKEEA